jgi:uncharacterized metal-binding protein
MNTRAEVFEKAEKVYQQDDQTRRMSRESGIVESKGYMVWPRLKDIIEFARGMEYRSITLLFCPDLWREAKKAANIISEQGFEVHTRVCGVGKKTPQSPAEFARELNRSEPELVVNAGLCIPFEAEVSQHASVTLTGFIARDKPRANYPVSAVYTSKKWKDFAKEVYQDTLGLE